MTSLTNRLLLKERVYTLWMAEGTPIKSHIGEFNCIIIEFGQIEDED